MVFDATDRQLVGERQPVHGLRPGNRAGVRQRYRRHLPFIRFSTCRERRQASAGQHDRCIPGIGFVSVYQVTDAPEIASGEWEWRIAPDAPPQERIRTARLSPPRTNTLITLAWAREDELADAACRRASAARCSGPVCGRRACRRARVLFLRHVRSIELRRNGERAGSAHKGLLVPMATSRSKKQRQRSQKLPSGTCSPLTSTRKRLGCGVRPAVASRRSGAAKCRSHSQRSPSYGRSVLREPANRTRAANSGLHKR